MDVCLNCQFNALDGTENREFRDIFDEIGAELKLDALVEKYYHINVSQIRERKICDQCLNNLIEIFDLDEHLRSKKNSTSVLQIENNSADYKICKDQWDSQRTKTDMIIDLIPQADCGTISDEGMRDDEKLIECEKENQLMKANSCNKNTPLFNHENNDLRENSQSSDEDFPIEKLEDDKNMTDQDSDNIDCDKLISDNGEVVPFGIVDEDESLQLTRNKVNPGDGNVGGVCCQDYDIININAYLDQAITTKFETLDLSWTITCRFCSCTHNTLKELLLHSCIIKQSSKNDIKCPISDCNIDIVNAELLARHLVVRHYDDLGSLQVYGSCPECNWSFSNFTLYNKHSCCRHLKRTPGVMNFCIYCKLEFPSLKRYFFHMQFHLSKYRPKVCLICEVAFNNSNDFFVHVQYSHEPANALACTKCDRFFKDKHLYDTHIKRHDSQSGYQCTQCNQKYEHRNNLLNHVEVYHNRRVKRYSCKNCGKIFVGRKNYRKHLSFHSQEINIQGYVCSQCGVICRSHEDSINHIKNSSNCSTARTRESIISVTYYCENCSLDFEKIDHLCKHRLTSEHNDELFRCILCEKLFNEFRCVRSHIKTHKNYINWLEAFPVCRMYVCNIGDCQEIYPVWSSLYYHKKRSHTKCDNKKQFQNIHICQFCKKVWPTKMSLAVHVARSHNTKNIKCPQCKNSYKDEQALQRHIEYMHTSVECDRCFKIMKNRRNFETHDRVVHKRTQRYHCNQCTKGFYHKSELENHLKYIHTDVVYKCNKCTFTTNYKNSLTIHVAKHENRMAFQCEFCSKSFTRKQILEMHIKKHHHKRGFTCNTFFEKGCDAAFVTRRDLKKHIEKSHNNGRSKDLIENSHKKSIKTSTNIVRIQEMTDDQQDHADDDQQDYGDDQQDYGDDQQDYGDDQQDYGDDQQDYGDDQQDYGDDQQDYADDQEDHAEDQEDHANDQRDHDEDQQDHDNAQEKGVKAIEIKADVRSCLNNLGSGFNDCDHKNVDNTSDLNIEYLYEYSNEINNTSE